MLLSHAQGRLYRYKSRTICQPQKPCRVTNGRAVPGHISHVRIVSVVVEHARSRDVNSDRRFAAAALKSHGSVIVHALAAPRGPRCVRPRGVDCDSDTGVCARRERRGVDKSAIIHRSVVTPKPTLEVLTINYKGPPRGGIVGAVRNLPLRTAAILILSAHRIDSIGAGDDFITAPPITAH